VKRTFVVGLTGFLSTSGGGGSRRIFVEFGKGHPRSGNGCKVVWIWCFFPAGAAIISMAAGRASPTP